MLYKITVTTDTEYDLCRVSSKGDANFILNAYLSKMKEEMRGSLLSVSKVVYRLYYRNHCIYESVDIDNN
jgi:hypothetical protein